MTVPCVDAAVASRYTNLALTNVVAEYPHKFDHLATSADDLAPPSRLHPVFYGSYDWHSAVHMHWSLVTLRSLHPQRPGAAAITASLDRRMTAANVAVELAYLERPGARTFERPYGWAWLLKLATALEAADDAAAVRWRDALRPLAGAIVERFVDWLPRADHPVRTGMHGNSAFALLFALEHAEAVGHAALRDLVRAKALAWFERDRRYPVAYEPGGEDFLSNGLVEAALMRRVFESEAAGLHESLARARFSAWWDGFVPDPAALGPWLMPVAVRDRDDARIAHLDGLNLARAWCWALVLDVLPDALRTAVDCAIDVQIASASPSVVDGPYVGTHWLVSFALLALDARAAARARRLRPERSGAYLGDPPVARAATTTDR